MPEPQNLGRHILASVHSVHRHLPFEVGIHSNLYLSDYKSVTKNRRVPAWTTHGDVFQYNPIQVWALDHFASTSVSTTVGKFPR